MLILFWRQQITVVDKGLESQGMCLTDHTALRSKLSFSNNTMQSTYDLKCSLQYATFPLKHSLRGI